MKKPVIAVDIDDVLTHTAEAVIEFSNDKWGMSLTLDDYDEDWHKLWKIPPDDEEEMHRRSKELRAAGVFFDEKLLPKADAERVLHELQKHASVVAVTSRRRAIEAETRRWIEQHLGGVIQEIHFAGIFDEDNEKLTTHSARIVATKHDILSAVRPDYFIDDQLKHCEAALTLGINTIVFGYYMGNKDTDIERRGATRCVSWTEVEAYFKAAGVLPRSTQIK
jgi:uncharacterized HAD superfamily protein